MLEVFTGDDWDISITLNKDSVAYDVSTATEILGSIVSSDNNDPQTLIGTVAADIAATGADWANGIVVLEFPATYTADVGPQEGYVEIQATIDGKKTTWPRSKVIIKKGTIINTLSVSTLLDESGGALLDETGDAIEGSP